MFGGTDTIRFPSWVMAELILHKRSLRFSASGFCWCVVCSSRGVGLGGGVGEQRSKMVLRLGSGGGGNFGSSSTSSMWAVGGRSNDCTGGKSEPIGGKSEPMGGSFQYGRGWVGRYPQSCGNSRVDEG